MQRAMTVRDYLIAQGVPRVRSTVQTPRQPTAQTHTYYQGVHQMNKSIWIGVVAGVGVAAAGGVAGYSFLGKQTASVQQQKCWDEQVTTVADPKDPHRIAGTAVGAVVGGAVGQDVGDRGITTAVGAAAGALIGRKVQEEIQDKNAEERTVTATVRRCAPVGS
jgi:uncharacterized protein YcfJ